MKSLIRTSIIKMLTNHSVSRRTQTSCPSSLGGTCTMSGSSGDSCLSTRAQDSIATPSVYKYKYIKPIMRDLYHPIDNPQGYVDLGIAENKLCEDVMTEKLQTIPNDTDVIPLRYYFNPSGTESFRDSLKIFIEREFKSVHTLDASQFVVQNGVTSLLDTMAFAIASPGEYIMSPTPCYYRIKNDFYERAGVNVLEVPLYNKTSETAGRPYSLSIADIEAAYLTARSEGKVVKGFILVNPNNPLGTVCTRKEITYVLDFCAKYKLHLIADEIYALSTFDPNVTFTSVLSVPHPDPQRTHFIWGVSKDFGLSGYRCGMLWTANTDLLNFLSGIGVFQATPALVQRRLQHMIDDVDWVHQRYMPALRSRLSEHYVIARDQLQQCGAYVTPVEGSIFIWLDCSNLMAERTHEEEMRLFEKFLAEKVFLLPGQQCYSREPGCFRMVFSIDKARLLEGLRRISNVLKRLKKPGN